jgi:hypothetical protein
MTHSTDPVEPTTEAGKVLLREHRAGMWPSMEKGILAIEREAGDLRAIQDYEKREAEARASAEKPAVLSDERDRLIDEAWEVIKAADWDHEPEAWQNLAREWRRHRWEGYALTRADQPAQTEVERLPMFDDRDRITDGYGERLPRTPADYVECYRTRVLRALDEANRG